MQRGRTASILSTKHLGTGGDLPLDLTAISGAGRGDQRRDFGVHWPEWRLCDYVGAKFRALIYPGAQQPDFMVGERPGRGHPHAAVAVHKAVDQLAGGAVADFDDWAVIAAAQSILAYAKPQTSRLNLRRVE